MSRFNHYPSAKYSEFRQAVREYAAADHEPGEDVFCAVADALEDAQREHFQNYWVSRRPPTLRASGV